MTKHHRRAARREGEAAAILGTTRVQRRRGERAPDLRPVTLPCGIELTVEVKTEARVPAKQRKALEQARAYRPGAVPAVVYSNTGRRAVIVLPARVFAQIAGISELALGAQLVLPLAPRPGGSPR